MQQNKLKNVVYNGLQEAIAKSVQQYQQMKPEERQKLEQQGMSLTALIYQNIQPMLDSTKISNILIVMDEGIGNMVMLTPIIRLLKTNHPLLKITVLCKETSAPVIDGWDLVDNIIYEFDNNYYDLCFITLWGQQTLKNHKEDIQAHCKMIIDTSPKTYHEAIQHLAPNEFLGGFGDLCLPHCEVQKIKTPDKKYIVFGDTTLRNFGWDRKRWPYYVELAKLFEIKYTDHEIVLVGDSKDKERFEKLTWGPNVTFGYCGSITIPELAYLISKAEFYVGNDTGPTHISGAVGTKTYAIFAPTLVSKNKPLGDNVVVINKHLPCSPCQWTERWDTCPDSNPCVAYPSAQEVFNEITGVAIKQKTMLLVGDFSGGALRNEHYIKRVMEEEYGYKVIPFPYRMHLEKTQSPVEATYALLNDIVNYAPTKVLICGGQQLIPEILIYAAFLAPNTELMNWYVDNRGGVEQWFSNLSSVCHKSYWSTGDPALLSRVFSQTQRPCEFLPIVPDSEHYYPTSVEKDIDVLFVGTPHSKPRIELLEYLVDNDIKVHICGDGDWPEKLKPFSHPGVFNEDFNDILNRAKIVIGINIINEVPLYFSDRYFYPMAVKTVGLNKYVPSLEEMFKNHEHMVFFNSNKECVDKIKFLLGDDDLRKTISEEGHKLYKEKYTLKTILKEIAND